MKKLILCLFIFIVYTSYSQWEACNNGLEGNAIISLAANDSYFFAGTDKNGVFVTNDNGKTWKQSYYPEEPSIISSIYIIKNKVYIHDNVYITWQGCCIKESNDYGKTWSDISPMSSPDEDRFYLLSKVENDLYLSTSFGNFVLKDTSSYWKIIFYKNFFPNIFTKVDKYLLAGCYGVDISIDEGRTWNKYQNELTGKEITTFEVKGDSVYAGTRKFGVYLSTNHGVTWLPRSTGLGSLSINTLAAKGYNIFAGTDSGGVYLSTDCGLTWQEKNKGLDNYKIFSSTIKDEYIYVGTINGVYRAKMLDLGITEVDGEEQILYNSFIVSPNPAHNEINIRLNTEILEPVPVHIFNMLGQQVLSGTVPAGDREIKLDMEGLPPGVYFIKTGENVRKFIKI